MASQSNTTKDHDEIRRWAEERGGKPAHVANTESKDDIGILRLEFPGAPGAQDSNLEPISWEQFFEKFDERGLALLYQEETASGEKSNFNKIVSAETAEEAEGSGRSSAKRSSKSGGSKNTGRKAASAGNARSSAAKKTASRPQPAKKTAAKKKTSKVSGSKAKKSAGAKRGAPAKKSASQSGRKAVAKKTAAKRTPAKKQSSAASHSRAGAKKTVGRRGR
jgi:hypothetical protein